ncbi:RNA methyltransferase [Helcococcus ovis]|uniref:TrmH family RNA methyltransferase n=1 Tax=Helcococcus ovis TaxID=72026 RepID=UPI00106F4585|nr:RNA methyltransferase [Helcococcus ovis]TFF68566.1 RNA methyltransferase [Helcococcus ovis]WNZ01293.1 RNA methyltransferase [Helcococcus ovis]
MRKYKKYSKKEDYSYTLGAFPTIELINSDKNIEIVFIDERYKDKENLISLLKEKNIRYEIASNLIKKLSDKDNTFVIGIFKKETQDVIEGNNHVVLHNISDMGNLGTIIRSMVGFSIYDLVLVGNVADVFNPRTIRASMGAFFKVKISHFDTMEDYIKLHKNNLYLFMLSMNNQDSIYKKVVKRPYSLVMGNEGSGLPKDFEKFGEKVFIPQSKDVDSLNLPIATSIGLYEFRRQDEINSI